MTIEDLKIYDHALTKSDLEKLYNNQKGNDIMTANRKKLNEITRDEWIVWNWLCVKEVQDVETVYIQGVERDPSASIRAGLEYDEWRKAYDTVEKASK